MLQLIYALILPWLILTLPASAASDDRAEQTGNRIALGFTTGQDFTATQQQLDFAASMGIDLIAFSDPAQMQNLSIAPFYILLKSDIRFPVINQLRTKRELFAELRLENYRAINETWPGQIAAVEVLSYPHEKDNRFLPLASGLANSLSAQIDSPLYFTSGHPEPLALPGGFSFNAARVTPTTVPDRPAAAFTEFVPNGSERESLIALNRILNSKAELESSVVLLPAEWFFNLLDKQPELNVVFEGHLNGEQIALPIPSEPSRLPGLNWSVLFLLLLWISFILHYKFQPVYNQSLGRYYFNHTFFVIDVMEHRIRNTLPGIIVMIQHAFITGLFFYVSAEIMVTALGLQALAHHFPALFFPGNPLISLFLAGLVLSLILQFLLVGWIYMLNKKLTHFSQVLHLYTLPLHVNLIFVTLLVVLNQTGTAEFLVITLSILFGLVWFLSFNLAAIDSAGFLNEYKIMNILLTTGIFTLLVVLVIWMFLYNPILADPIRLAISF
ncbi:MAG: hypothetical protein EA390_00070 [Balneolaceae bacterium]|nr:MAG: hypothetical protein EA390_00070 [Balneolaceae bacterium]